MHMQQAEFVTCISESEPVKWGASLVRDRKIEVELRVNESKVQSDDLHHLHRHNFTVSCMCGSVSR